MTAARNTTRLLLVVSAFLAGLALGACALYLALDPQKWRISEPTIELGTVSEVLEEAILTFTYSKADMTLTAQRTKPGEGFAVQVTFADGRSTQQCLATPDLAGQLTHFSTLTATRQVPVKQFASEFPIQLATIEIRDGMNGEIQPPIEFRSTKDKKSVAAALSGLVFETATPFAAFVAMEAGCQRLAVPPAHR